MIDDRSMKSLTLFATLSCFTLHLPAAAESNPNILLIYADDIGWGDLSCYGGSGADTPNVDRLAAEGIRFTSAYADSAMCTPSRYSLLSGEYSFRNDKAEILPGNAPLLLDPARPTIATLLRDQGYATALVGKWHLGLGGETLDWNGEISPGPSQLGFDYSFYMAATADRVPSVYIENGRVVNLDPNDPIQVHYEEPVGDEPTGLSHPELLRWPADVQHSGTIVGDISRIGFMSGGHEACFKDEDMLDEFVNKAVGFIGKHKDDPFFLYFAPSENHVPRAVHDRFKGTSRLGPRGDALVAFDWAVARLIGELKTQGIYENTLVIVSSDNGGVLFDGYLDNALSRNGNHRPNGPFRGGKYSRSEGGPRVPLIVSWPGVTQPGVSDAIVGQIDLYASFASLLGAPMPEGAGGDTVDVLPALLGQSDTGRDFITYSAWKQLAIRRGDWKYLPPGTILKRGGMEEWHRRKVEEPGFLFNLADDPAENTNLAGEHPEILTELRTLLDDVRKGPVPQAGTSPVRNIQDVLAPDRLITDVTSSPPGKLQFTSISERAFRLSGDLPNKQAMVVLRPEGGHWDISDHTFFRVDFVNNGPGLVWIRGRLDNPGALDWANSTPSQAFVMPGERATLGFPFPRADDLNDAPAIFNQQSGKPNGHRTHWKDFDPANVIACRLTIQSTSAMLDLNDMVISVAQPYGVEANADLMELPYLDAFGQVRRLDWAGKLHSEADLQRRHEEEAIALARDKGPAAFNQYGGWANGPQLEATGFFRAQKFNDKWWLVDPAGRLFFSHGANSVGFDQTTPVTGRNSLFAWLPDDNDALMEGVIQNSRVHFTVANLARTFGPDWREPADDRVHRRLRDWGMNTLGAWSDLELIEDKRTPYTPILHVGGDWSPLGKKISDPFARDFKERLIAGLRRTVPDPEDPWVVGVFIDNEIYWTEPFVHNAFSGGRKMPARVACMNWLKEKYKTIAKLNTAWDTSYGAWEDIGELPETESVGLKADIVALKRLISGTYYRLCREAMREALPNHLYIGSRQHKGPLEVYEESAKYLDVLSLNSYEPLSGATLPRGIDLPAIDTEFHFAAPDRGVPGVGLWPVGDQTQRARAYIAYVVSSLKHPNMVGTHWFAFADQSAAGRPGENYQIGFVDVTDTPYPEITTAARRMAERMYEIGTDSSSSLLETLEALWSGDDLASTGGELAYTITQADGVEWSRENGVTRAHGEGNFNLVLEPESGGAWDMSAIRVLGLMLRNTGDTELVLDLRLRNDGASEWSNSALGRTIVEAGEAIPLGVALQRLSNYGATHPAYLRMSGRPDGSFRHWHTFNPGKVRDLVITGSAEGEYAFELGSMFALQPMRPELADALPIVDRYGQYLYNDWPGKVHSDQDIRDGIAVEAALAEQFDEFPDLNQYGGWKTGPQLEATGFFRTGKVDGRWWFVDPEGRLFWSFGVNTVGIEFAAQTPTERDPAVFQYLPAEDDPQFGQFHVKLDVEENFLAKVDVPHYDFTAANLYRKYGADWKQAQIDNDIRRLHTAKINTIGAWSDAGIIKRREVPYVAMLHYVYPEAAPKLPDPFDPETRMGLQTALSEYPVDFSNDPWCLGVFVDNELHWKNDSRHLIAAILGHEKTGTAVRRVFRDWLQQKYGSLDTFNSTWNTSLATWDDLLTTTNPAIFSNAARADCAELATLFADTFFGMIREELTAYSPNVLYLGGRMNSGPPEVIDALARHADVISVNVYAYRPEPGQYGATDKPVLISEFHFANVSGNNLGGGLRSAQDALQQGRLLRRYVAEAVRHPQIIGTHWFQWRDHSAAGRYDGENYHIGLFDVADLPNEELIRAMEASGRTLYQNAP